MTSSRAESLREAEKELTSLRHALSRQAGGMADQIRMDRLFSPLSSSRIPDDIDLGAFSTLGSTTISGDPRKTTTVTGEIIPPQRVPLERTDGSYLEHLSHLFSGSMDHRRSQDAYDKEILLIVGNLNRIRSNVIKRLGTIAEELDADGQPILEFIAVADDQNVGDMSEQDFSRFHGPVEASVKQLDGIGTTIRDILGRLVNREPQAQKIPDLKEASKLMQLLGYMDGIIKKCMTYQDAVAKLQKIGTSIPPYQDLSEAMQTM